MYYNEMKAPFHALFLSGNWAFSSICY